LSAAYRAGERIRDDRSGELHNYTRRRDVLHTEIFLPSQFDGMHVTWARNREKLWNTAEHAEKRHNSRVAREYQLSLPIELDAGQRLGLARSFAREIAERYKVAVDLAVHEPRSDGDPRNFHAHLLTTTREVTPAGLGAKAGLDMSPLERRRHELPDHRQEFINIRERWATLTNQALHEANVAARVDHRSLAAQRIECAISQARDAGLSPAGLRIEVLRGAGGYVCGEESVILNSIEGQRAVPRLRPPFPAESGLWGQPTVVNNAETLASLPLIVRHGSGWFRAVGSEQAPGTKLLCVSGAVPRPGLVEVPFGTPLRRIVEELAGAPAGRPYRSGGSPGFCRPSHPLPPGPHPSTVPFPRRTCHPAHLHHTPLRPPQLRSPASPRVPHI